MSRHGWLRRCLVAAALSIPIAAAAVAPAAADRRHDSWGGGHHGHTRHHWDSHRHHHHGSGISGLFVFDLSPPPPRRVYVQPAPVYMQPPPVIYQAPPPVIYQAPPPVAYQPPPQPYCREYTATVMVNGRPAETFGTACLQPDGSWRIVSMN